VRPGAESTVARTALDGYLGVRAGETVTVEAWSHALPWARRIVVEARRLGAEPILVVEDEEAFFGSLEELPRASAPASPAALAPVGDAHVYLPGPESFLRLRGVPPSERGALVERHDAAWRAAARRSRTRFARLAVADATPVAAQQFGVDLAAWREELVGASAIPPSRLAARLGGWLARWRRARRVRIRHPNGTDLAVELRQGGLRVDDGRSAAGPPRYATDIPTGRLIARTRDGTADGVWEANRPLYDRFSESPVQLPGRFRFHRGRLAEFSFDRGGEAFAVAYAAGGRGRDALGAIVVGANPRIVRAPERSELADGTVSVLVGGTSSIGGRNRSPFSRIVSLGGADVELDGRPWLVRGRAVRDGAAGATPD